MLDVLMVTMSLIATFAMMFLAYFLYEYHIKITELESEIAKFKQICANLNTKKDALETDIRRMRGKYQNLWVKYNESEENSRVISKLQMEANDATLTYMKMVDELVRTIDNLVTGHHISEELPPEEVGKLYARLKKRGKLVADIYDPES
tara:strand:- start:532 stop:978 length:447 start_codon:yes stop_codon:yes gene_type:complete